MFMWISKYLLFFIVLISILVLSILPINIEIIHSNNSDKINHIVAFFVLTNLMYFSFFDLNKIYILFYLILFGFIIECIQYLLPYRQFSLFDISADVIGIFSAFTIIYIANYINNKYLKSLK